MSEKREIGPGALLALNMKGKKLYPKTSKNWTCLVLEPSTAYIDPKYKFWKILINYTGDYGVIYDGQFDCFEVIS